MTNLSRLAQDGLLRGAVGVDQYLLPLARGLARFDKSAVALVGKEGTGKSAIMDQYAIDQAAGRWPPPLGRWQVVRFSFFETAALQPANQPQNDYPYHFQTLIDDSGKYQCILFIDELAAASAWPQSCAILKTAIQEDAVKFVGATTPSEFARFIGRDPALERRFQVIRVEEPNEAALRQILRHVAASLEPKFNVTVDDYVIDDCIRRSRCLGQNSPDGAIDLLELTIIGGSGLFAPQSGGIR